MEGNTGFTQEKQYSQLQKRLFLDLHLEKYSTSNNAKNVSLYFPCSEQQKESSDTQIISNK